MGWASGSELAEAVWTNLRSYISKDDRKKLARLVIELFENEDCDTIDEAEQLCKDAGREHDTIEGVVYR